MSLTSLTLTTISNSTSGPSKSSISTNFNKPWLPIPNIPISWGLKSTTNSSSIYTKNPQATTFFKTKRKKNYKKKITKSNNKNLNLQSLNKSKKKNKRKLPDLLIQSLTSASSFHENGPKTSTPILKFSKRKTPTSFSSVMLTPVSPHSLETFSRNSIKWMNSSGPEPSSMLNKITCSLGNWLAFLMLTQLKDWKVLPSNTQSWSILMESGDLLSLMLRGIKTLCRTWLWEHVRPILLFWLFLPSLESLSQALLKKVKHENMPYSPNVLVSLLLW